MTNQSKFIVIGIAVLVLLLLSAMFPVHQTQSALVLRLGKVVNDQYEPGLNFKLPLIDKVRFFDKRLQTLDAPPEQFLTSEKKNVIVDSFVKWRIQNVVKYFTSVGGNPQIASQRLSEFIADGLRKEFGTRTIQQVISEDRSAIMQDITNEANLRAEPFGITVIDVRIKRIDLPPEVSNSVYRRMEAERERVAKELRSRGEAEAVRIRASADKQKIVLLADAQREADTIRGEGDRAASEIYAQAYQQDAEFYSLYRSLMAYRQSFDGKDDILVLQPDSEFFRYFKQYQAPQASSSVAPTVAPLTAPPAAASPQPRPEPEPLATPVAPAEPPKP